MGDWLTPDEWRAVALSLRVSFWATLVSLPLGLLVAYALARWTFWGKQLLNGLVHLPLILPPVFLPEHQRTRTRADKQRTHVRERKKKQKTKK